MALQMNKEQQKMPLGAAKVVEDGGWNLQQKLQSGQCVSAEVNLLCQDEELNECRGRGGESAGKPVKSSPEIGGVVEETNAADSVRAQVSMIESLFATSGSSLPLLADKAAATTADKGGKPEHLNAEAGGEGGAWHHSEKKTSGEDTDIADSKTLEPECTGGHIQSRDDGDREDGRNRLGGAATAEMPSSVKSQAFKCQCVSVCVCGTGPRREQQTRRQPAHHSRGVSAIQRSGCARDGGGIPGVKGTTGIVMQWIMCTRTNVRARSVCV